MVNFFFMQVHFFRFLLVFQCWRKKKKSCSGIIDPGLQLTLTLTITLDEVHMQFICLVIPNISNDVKHHHCIVLLKNGWTSLKRNMSQRQQWYLSVLSTYLQECCHHSINHTDVTPYHHGAWLLDLLLMSVWMVRFLLWSRAYSIHLFGNKKEIKKGKKWKRSRIMIKLITIQISTEWGSIPDVSEAREVNGAACTRLT